MNRLRINIFSILLAAVLSAAFAATDTREQIFDRHFRTLKTQVEDNFMGPNVIRLDTQDRIIINFDELGDDYSDLEYRLIHCNADWQPSRLVESEYLDGFNGVKIDDWAYSSNVFVHYVNYQVAFPTDDLRVIHSGNYLFQVYRQEDPDDVVLQTRFRVVEPGADVSGYYTTRTDFGHNTEWQQLDFAIDAEGFPIQNPYSDLKVLVEQNNRESTQRRLEAPQRVEGSRYYYQHNPSLIFPGGNEYRRFESTSNGFPGMNVDSLRYMGSNYHVWLKPDEEKAQREYQYDRTQHGRYIVREYNATDSNIGADYITVYFTLDFPELIDGDIYVNGEMTHGIFDERNRMTYNRDRHVYELQMPLKQGQYNYQYVARKRNSDAAPTPALVEGNKYETDNEYSVAVYYCPPGARADRLIGFGVIEAI